MIHKLIDLITGKWEEYFPGEVKPRIITPIMAKALRNVIFFLLKDNDKFPFAQVKIGTDEKYIRYCKKETKALQHIFDKKYGTLLSSYSKVLYSDMLDGYYVHIRKFLPGRSIQNTIFFGDKFGIRRLQPLINWTAQAYLETKYADVKYDFSTASYEKYLAGCVKSFVQRYSLSQKERQFLDNFVISSKSGLGACFSIAFEHGDLNPGNVIDGRDGFFLIDWAQANFDGFPLCDVINFFIWYGMIVCPEDVCRSSLTNSMGDKTKATWITKGLIRNVFFSDNECSRLFKNYALSYMKTINLDPGLMKFLFTAFSIRQPVFELFQLLHEEEDNFIFNK